MQPVALIGLFIVPVVLGYLIGRRRGAALAGAIAGGIGPLVMGLGLLIGWSAMCTAGVFIGIPAGIAIACTVTPTRNRAL